MSVYHLLQAAQDVTSATPQMPSVRPRGPGMVNSEPSQATYQLVVSGVGAVSATATVYGTNDNLNFVALGDPITAAGTNNASASFVGIANYARYTAALTALSGTGAKADVLMAV